MVDDARFEKQLGDNTPKQLLRLEEDNRERKTIDKKADSA